MEKLIDKADIVARVAHVAQQISVDHDSPLPPVMICVLNGAYQFFADLTSMMSIDCEVDFIRIKSYDGRDNSGGTKLIKSLETDLKGKTVYIVDDILDTGATIIEALSHVNGRMPKSVKVVTLLKRRGSKMQPDYCAFEIGDEFVYGYGLDDNKLKRNLMDIYKIN